MVYGDRAADPRLNPGIGGQRTVRFDADSYQNHICCQDSFITDDVKMACSFVDSLNSATEAQLDLVGVQFLFDYHRQFT